MERLAPGYPMQSPTREHVAVRDSISRARSIELLLSDDDLEITAQHRVNGTPIVPAAVLLLHVMYHCSETHSQQVVLKNVRFLRPLYQAECSNGDLHLRLYSRAQDGERKFEIASKQNVLVQGAVVEYAETTRSHNLLVFEPTGTVVDDQTGSWYAELSTAGNQFGDRLQLVNRIEVRGDSPIGDKRVHFANTSSVAASLDACFHAVLAASASKDRSRVLSSIDEIVLAPKTSGVSSCLIRYQRPHHVDEILADVFVPRSEQILMQARGISFVHTEERRNEQAVAALANFTIDPLKEAFDYLAMDVGLHLDLGQYDQICQGLIAPSQMFGSAIFNELFVLLRLESWWKRKTLAGGNYYDAAIAQGARAHVLPNGLEVLELNRYETEHLYREIFDDAAYLSMGIEVRDRDTVLDIGANIGMFALFLTEVCPSARVISFEPSPITAAVLRANVYGRGSVEVREQGLGRARAKAVFRHYDKSSVFSGYATEAEADRQAIRSIVGAELHRSGIEVADDSDLDQLMRGRTDGRDFQTEVVSISDVIDELHLSEIGLLKIDAEKSEFEILAGVRNEHWARIRQIALELHEREPGDLARATSFLNDRGFRVSRCDDAALARAGLHMLLASRHSSTLHVAPPDVLGLNGPIDTLASAIQAFRQQRNTPLTIVVTQDSQASSESKYVAAAHRSAVERLKDQCSGIAGVELALGEEIEAFYPSSVLTSSQVEIDSNIPYERNWYAGTAAWLLRRHLARIRRPHKVIVVDCDDTLWEGSCAEHEGGLVRFSRRHRVLQDWLVAQRRDGMLVCLSSKNDEDDVTRVFKQSPEMSLTLEDIVALRVNWDPKSSSLKALAFELDLALEDFIFIDNNPLECAEVTAHCPGVLALVFPDNDADAEKFVRHIWAFDRAPRAHELDRTQMYQAERHRRAMRAKATSFSEFLDSLQLETRFDEIRSEDLPRISELTLRTNQFNLNHQHRTVPELIHFLGASNHLGWSVRARDRFGDYGCVGAVLAGIDGDTLLINTFLLSCRILGRGVEYRLIRFLAETAKSKHLEKLRFIVSMSRRNTPALKFIRGMPTVCAARPTGVFEYELDVNQGIRVLPEQLNVVIPSEQEPGELEGPARMAPWDERYRDGAWMLRRLQSCSSATDIAANVWGQDFLPHTAGADGQNAILEIWSHVLRRAVGDPDANFFALGGTSLQLIRVVKEINRTMRGSISLSQAYASPTVSGLQALVAASTANDDLTNDGSGEEPTLLSPAQQALWFLHLSRPESTIYNVPIVLSFRGDVDETRLRAAMMNVLSDNPVLATTYALQGKLSVPMVGSAALEWISSEGNAGVHYVLGIAERLARMPIDLRSGPTVRVQFIQEGKSQSALVIVAHHIAMDFESMGILVRKLASGYAGGVSAEPVSDTYARFARIQEKYLREHGARLEGFWKNELLPSNIPRSSLPSELATHDPGIAGDGVLFELDTQLITQIKTRSETLSVSKLVLLVAAFACFLREETQTQDVEIGIPISLRSNGNFAHTIGNFVNTVPLTLRLEGAIDLKAVANITRDALQRAIAAADLPLQRILRQAMRSASGQVLELQTTFAFHENKDGKPFAHLLAHRQPSPPFEFAPQIQTRIVGLRQQAGHCDIAVDVLDLGERWLIDVKFATAKFERRNVDAWGRRFIKAIQRAVQSA